MKQDYNEFKYKKYNRKGQTKTIGFSSDRKLESQILKLQKENNKKIK